MDAASEISVLFQLRQQNEALSAQSKKVKAEFKEKKDLVMPFMMANGHHFLDEATNGEGTGPFWYFVKKTKPAPMNDESKEAFYQNIVAAARNGTYYSGSQLLAAEKEQCRLGGERSLVLECKPTLTRSYREHENVQTLNVWVSSPIEQAQAPPTFQ